MLKMILLLFQHLLDLGAPYWRSDIRGSIHGITRDTSKSDIALAALKSVCFQSRDYI
jgi:glycerol kinase